MEARRSLRGTLNLFLPRLRGRDARQLTAGGLGAESLRAEGLGSESLGASRYRSNRCRRSSRGNLRYRGATARGAEAQRHIRAHRMSGRLRGSSRSCRSCSRCGLSNSGNGTFYLVRARSVRARKNLSRLINPLHRSLSSSLLNVDNIALKHRVLHVSRLRRHRNRNRSRD